MKRFLLTSMTENDVIDFWIGEAATSAELARKRKQLWYRSGSELDDAISEQFGDLLHAAISGELSQWRNSPRGCLALIILLDQFSRHIYRGQPDAFAQDTLALEIVLGLEQHRELAFIERAFLYHPFEHAESMEMQIISVARFQELKDEASPPWQPMMSDFYRHACEHREIIERFGRFPHRNDILGRVSTVEEQQFLAEGGATFGQKLKK